MKKLSTPQKNNLPVDKRRLEALMRNAGRDELELRERLLGKNTLQAARIIAEEFVKRFGKISGTVNDVTKKLLPNGQALKWQTLDLNINLFCKQFYPQWQLVAKYPDGTEKVLDIKQRHEDEIIGFFDRVRFVLCLLPRQRDYKLPEHKAEYSTDYEIARNFVPCFLCWRSVARKPFEKKTPLCNIHDLPSTYPEYRRRKRLRIRMLEIKDSLWEIVPKSSWMKDNTTIHPRDFFAGMCINPDGFFPFLARYLASLGMPLDCPEDIMRALEHPVYFGKLSDLMKKAWEFHFADMGEYFEYNYDKLLQAEAWLQAEAENQHGGKR